MLLILLIVASLPGCSSVGPFLPGRNVPALREARRSAFVGEPGGWSALDTKDRSIKHLVEAAAKQADVIPSHVVQAFYKHQQYGTNDVSARHLLYFVSGWI